MRTEEDKIWFMEENKFDLEAYQEYERLSNEYLEIVVNQYVSYSKNQTKQTLLEVDKELQKDVYFICSEVEFEYFIDELYPNISDLFHEDEIEEKIQDYYKIDFFRERGIDKVILLKNSKFTNRSYLINRLEKAKKHIESLRI